ncbi:hypothetical protein [Mycobacteroides abscessus]|uniref:hypothetical protein n=1 Tax=Mycobacteroides abscessus TaxID=36809 RepID=UPI00104A4629|nr:hypothetical protein [Mycobacteroides abscessus]
MTDTIQRFRKKPVEVEAIRYEVHVRHDWTGARAVPRVRELERNGMDDLGIETLDIARRIDDVLKLVSQGYDDGGQGD